MGPYTVTRHTHAPLCCLASCTVSSQRHSVQPICVAPARLRCFTSNLKAGTESESRIPIAMPSFDVLRHDCARRSPPSFSERSTRSNRLLTAALVFGAAAGRKLWPSPPLACPAHHPFPVDPPLRLRSRCCGGGRRTSKLPPKGHGSLHYIHPHPSIHPSIPPAGQVPGLAPLAQALQRRAAPWRCAPRVRVRVRARVSRCWFRRLAASSRSTPRARWCSCARRAWSAS